MYDGGSGPGVHLAHALEIPCKANAARDGWENVIEITAAMVMSRSRARLCGLAAVFSVCALLLPVPLARADTPAPAWYVSAVSYPTVWAAGSTNAADQDQYFVTVTNTGGAASAGVITITDTLPAGVTLDGSPSARDSSLGSGDSSLSCASASQTITCTISTQITQGQIFQLRIPVDVAADASGAPANQVSVTGGGAASSASVSQPTTIDSSPAPVGFVAGPAGLGEAVTSAGGSTDTQAGSHPYQGTVDVNFPAVFDQATGGYAADGQLDDLTVNLPAGGIVNPNPTLTQCTAAELAQSGDCPLSSQVGTVAVQTFLGGTSGDLSIQPLFNMVPPAGVPAVFGFYVNGLGKDFQIQGGVRTGGDYGLSFSSSGINDQYPIVGIQLSLWGDPSDSSHDLNRGSCSSGGGSCPVGGFSVPSSTMPLLAMPSQCSGPLTGTASMDTWQDPGSFVSASAQTEDANGNPVGVTGCGQLSFAPQITVTPDTTVADSPAGLSVDVSVPQPESQTELAEANLEQATITLPVGISVDPAAAGGLGACMPAEIGLENATEPACPASSQIGSVQATTPSLSDPLTGAVYLAQQYDNPFNSLLAVYVTAQADGVLLKLAGQVHADPITGQLTLSFDGIPQLPLSELTLDLPGGPGAVLATPDDCGSYLTASSLSPWSGTPAVASSDAFGISSGCVTGFAPAFTAAAQDKQAGAYSPLLVSFSRTDADQNFSGASVGLSPGLLAKLAGVHECSDAQLAAAAASSGTQEQASPSCPAASQVGTVQIAAGAGPDPLGLVGSAYLTGPYKNAPYGLALVVPALAGPYDLGTMVVRQALAVNPVTAQLTDTSDSLPTILQGIPLRIRSVQVDLDRPQFTLNPTSCSPMSLSGTLTSTDGRSAAISSPSQASGCQTLPFSPTLKLTLAGKGQTYSGDHPTLSATLTQRAGQANIRAIRLVLPRSLALDPRNPHLCPYATAQQVHGGAVGCPGSSIIGTATTVTPLLSQALSGKVYLVQGIRFERGRRIRTLPTVLIPLRGQIAIDLRAETSVNSASQLVTTFSTIPDAAVSKLTLQINGGPKGILVITGRGRSICGKKQVATVTMGAQSGKSEALKRTLGTPACRGLHKPKQHKQRH